MYSADSNYMLKEQNRSAIIEALVIFCIVCRLGFPGNYAILFGGDSVKLAIDYASSALQAGIILFESGDSIVDIRLLDFKRKYLPIYCMLILVFVVSMIVSQNRIKQTTIMTRFALTAFFGLWLVDRYDVRYLIKLLLSAQTVIVFLNLMAYFVFRKVGFHYDEGYGYIFRGIYQQKNGLGAEMAMGLVLQFTSLRIKSMHGESVSVAGVFVFFIQVFLLIVCRSTSSLMTAVITILFIFLSDRPGAPQIRPQWGIVYAVGSIGFLFAAMSVLPLFSPILEALGKDATLSNRVPMWHKITEFMLHSHTLTGYGLLMFWNTPWALHDLQSQFKKNSWFRKMSYGAHNTLLEMWLDIGLIGLAAYILTIIICFQGKDKLTKEQYILCSALMIPNLLEGLTDRQYTNSNYSTLFLFLMLGVACSWQDEYYRRQRSLDTE